MLVALLSACGGSGSDFTASPTATGSPSGSANPYVELEEWGLRFRVHDAYHDRLGPVWRGADQEVVIFGNDELTEGWMGMVMLVRVEWPYEYSSELMITHLNDRDGDIRREMLDTFGPGGRVTVVEPPAPIRLENGWEAVAGDFIISVPADAAAGTGAGKFRARVIFFERDGYLFELSMATMPAAVFEAHRAELELTPRTLETIP